MKYSVDRYDPEFEADAKQFLRAYPAYCQTELLDDFRSREFARLDEIEHVYLDFAGASLYATSQVRRHAELLTGHVFGNPHSYNPAATLSSQFEAAARADVLRFFRASPNEYSVIFTANATAAAKLVGESYPFGPQKGLLLTADNHNSVNGLRQFARSNHAEVKYIPINSTLGLEGHVVHESLRCNSVGIFAYPAQSNYSGVQHDLAWVGKAQALGWNVMLDASAYVPTNRLDLSEVQPDFVILSFYKMFGYPTGIGALLIRHRAIQQLRRPWFAGGSVSYASTLQPDWQRLASGFAGFEDGTANYLALPAISLGFEIIEQLGIETVHQRVATLTDWLINAIGAACHSNTQPIARIFGPATSPARGGTIAFQLLDPHGIPFPAPLIERMAAAAKISLRTGCFCNPGAAESTRGVSRTDIRAAFDPPPPASDSWDYREMLRNRRGVDLDSVRVSLGWVSNFADVWYFMSFVDLLRDVEADELRSWADDVPSCLIEVNDPESELLQPNGH